MGLAGRKQKQRIPADPRNLSWADDASRFGLAYLSKLGWDASQGLGSSGDGMKTHLKVQQKLDMMGIGAQHQRDPNGIAWKQNEEFEALLKRLNESAQQGKGTAGEDGEEEHRTDSETVMGGAFVRAQEEEEVGSATTKKRKREIADDPDASGNAKKKLNKENKENRRKSRSDTSDPPTVSTPEHPSTLPSSDCRPKPKPRQMAHRERIRAAKRITGKSASAISEILGIAPSASVSTSASTPAPQTSLSLDNLTTSTKSVAEYFKERLLARASSSSSPASSSSIPSGSVTPGLGASFLRLGSLNAPPPDDEDDRTGSQAPPIESRSASGPISIPPPAQDGDGGDDLTEKRRLKADRKAEKRKRREAKAQATSEGVSMVVKEQAGEDHTQAAKRLRSATKERDEKIHREQEQHAPADQPDDNNDDATMRSRKHTPSGSSPERRKKSKKEHKKKRS